nr:eukaryotic peptide chain release factor GTP-binding subunit ERF3A-like isoform X1 [Ipomoea batatas]
MLPILDIEEDIKALQLDSSVEDTHMANADDGKPDEVVKPDETDEMLRMSHKQTQNQCILSIMALQKVCD